MLEKAHESGLLGCFGRFKLAADALYGQVSLSWAGESIKCSWLRRKSVQNRLQDMK